MVFVIRKSVTLSESSKNSFVLFNLIIACQNLDGLIMGMSRYEICISNYVLFYFDFEMGKHAENCGENTKKEHSESFSSAQALSMLFDFGLFLRKTTCNKL